MKKGLQIAFDISIFCVIIGLLTHEKGTEAIFMLLLFSILEEVRKITKVRYE